MRENHILPFVWMRGEPEEVVREEIEKIYEAGIRSVCLEARPHPDYAGEGWWHDVDIVVDEAQKRDMQIWILDDSHFPTGMANYGMKNHPDKARRWLVSNFVDVTGPIPSAQLDVELLMTKQFTWMDFGKNDPKPLIEESSLLSVTAARVAQGDTLTGEIMDLTDQVNDGYLTADIPKGVWRIFVNFTTTAFGALPEYINYIEADSVRVLIDEVYEKHYSRYKDLFGTVIAGFFSDEPGYYNTEIFDESNFIGQRMPLPWGREMNELLVDRYGSDIYRKIPYLFAEDENGAHRDVRVAYMDTVTYLYGKNFTTQIGDWCRAHGVQYIGHVVEDNCGYMRMGSGVGHYFRAMKGQDMAGIDNIGYQLMPGNDVAIRHTGVQDIDPVFFHYALGKLGSSAAALDPKKKGRLMCENFGAYGWRLGVRDMKWLVDYLVVQGVNYFVPHAFSMADYPDQDCPPHFYARGNNPQYPWFCDLMKYTDRLCRLFSDGMGIPQAGVLFEAEADWAGKTMRGSAVGKALLTNQIDYIFLPADVFCSEYGYDCSVKESRLIINDRQLKILIVPACEYIPAAAAEFIAAHSKFPVIYIDRLPDGIAGAAEDKDALLKAAVAGRQVVSLQDLPDYLRANNICDDLKIVSANADLRQYHYKKENRDYYFLVNTSLSDQVNAVFDLPDDRKYAFYNAMTEETVEAPCEGRKLNIVLEPYQSVILLSDPADAKKPEAESHTRETIVPDSWQLTLNPIGGKNGRIIDNFDLKPVALIDRDFSGEMIYRTSIRLDAVPEKAVLTAQYVYECMGITVNGIRLPNVLTPPYTADLTSALNGGKNEIEIRVVSTALRDANTSPGIFGKERTILEPTGMFGEVKVLLY